MASNLWLILTFLQLVSVNSSLAEFYELAGAPSTQEADATRAQCRGGFCSNMHHYPVNGTYHYAEFNVPKLPMSVGPTFFIYYNIDWQDPGPKGSDARMNQFVPQLMLGTPLDSSSGPPFYKPIWHVRKTWVFGAQYFFEIFNQTANKKQAKAATGQTYPCVSGEQIFTEFYLSEDWIWTLNMGVVGDPSRLSTVVVEKPFMGLLPPSQTKSWSELVYAKAWSNTCWEFKGHLSSENYPQSDQRTSLTLRNSVEIIPWGNWSVRSQPNCSGAPVASIYQTSSGNALHVTLDINRTQQHYSQPDTISASNSFPRSGEMRRLTALLSTGCVFGLVATI